MFLSTRSVLDPPLPLGCPGCPGVRTEKGGGAVVGPGTWESCWVRRQRVFGTSTGAARPGGPSLDGDATCGVVPHSAEAAP